MIGGAVAGSLLENLITTDNYILFLTTKLTWNGETRVKGIGAFENIFFILGLQIQLLSAIHCAPCGQFRAVICDYKTEKLYEISN